MTLKQALFLLLSIAGLIGTWYYNIQFFITAEDTSMLNYIAQTKTTFPAKSFNFDLLIGVGAFLLWYIPEARKLKMKLWWVFIPLTFLIAFAFAFPLFLFFRERALAKQTK